MLQNNIKTAAAWRYHEDKWICRLKTSAPHGLNTEIGDYAKEMYKFYQLSNEVSILCLHDNEKYDRFRTEIVEFVVFPECNRLVSSFLFTRCYNVMSSLTSILCLNNRITRSERQRKHSVFSLKFLCPYALIMPLLPVWNKFDLKIFCFLDFKILFSLAHLRKLILAKIHILLHFRKLVFTKSRKNLFTKVYVKYV